MTTEDKTPSDKPWPKHLTRAVGHLESNLGHAIMGGALVHSTHNLKKILYRMPNPPTTKNSVMTLLASSAGAGLAIDGNQRFNNANESKQYMNKQAAFNELINAGYNYTEAVEAIQKEAGIASSAKAAFGKLKHKLKPGYPKSTKTDPNYTSKSTSMAETPKPRFSTKQKIGAGLSAAAAAGAAGYAMSGDKEQEKKACVDQLMAEGIDFDSAVEMTKQASLEIYGE